MSNTNDLDSFLDGDVVPESEEVVSEEGNEIPTDEPTPTTEGAEEPKGEEPETAEEPSTPEGKKEPDPQQQESEVEKGLKQRAFYLAEQNRQLKEQLQQKEQQDDEQSFLDDPEGFAKRQSESLKQAEQRITLNVSERLARSRYDDFQEKVEVFAEMAQQMPHLHAEMVNAEDPGEYVYRTAERHLQIKELGDPKELREKIRAEERQALQKEFDEKLDAELKRRQRLPGSIADSRAADTDSTSNVKDDSLDEIIG